MPHGSWAWVQATGRRVVLLFLLGGTPCPSLCPIFKIIARGGLSLRAGLSTNGDFNGRAGVVQDKKKSPKPGRLAVLLDGESKPMSIREVNLQKADGLS